MPDAPAYDAAVVGGGPAGCSAAISLAAGGARVVLLEARAYPHDKLCGEFLSPECVPLLGALGLSPALRALGHAMAQRAQVAGAELRTGQAVTAITGSLAQGFTLQTGRGPAITALAVI